MLKSSLQLKKKFERKEFSLGTWMTLAHPSIAEIFLDAGYEWIVLDNEHSCMSLGDIQTLLALAQGRGVPGLVRVSHNNPSEIRKMMDAGASGIICPMINHADHAKQLIDAAKYPPMGCRSYGLSRAQKYGSGSAEYFSECNSSMIVIAQIEHIEGVRNIDSILSVKGLDGVLMGPYDLSGSLNLPGQLDHPEVVQAEKEILSQCRKRGMACGAHLVHPSPEQIRKKLDQGYDFLAVGVDIIFLGEGARAARAKALAEQGGRE